MRRFMLLVTIDTAYVVTGSVSSATLSRTLKIFHIPLMKFDLGTSCVVLCDVVRKYESFPELIFV
jgi:hypothetical protein